MVLKTSVVLHCHPNPAVMGSAVGKRHWTLSALAFALARAGSNIAARMAMMAITTSNSMSVKPVRLLTPSRPTADLILVCFTVDLPVAPSGRDINTPVEQVMRAQAAALTTTSHDMRDIGRGDALESSVDIAQPSDPEECCLARIKPTAARPVAGRGTSVPRRLSAWLGQGRIPCSRCRGPGIGDGLVVNMPDYVLHVL
jgi:hypothetical protein